jgi:hypothetical protein
VALLEPLLLEYRRALTELSRDVGSHLRVLHDDAGSLLLSQRLQRAPSVGGDRPPGGGDSTGPRPASAFLISPCSVIGLSDPGHRPISVAATRARRDRLHE